MEDVIGGAEGICHVEDGEGERDDKYDEGDDAPDEAFQVLSFCGALLPVLFDDIFADLTELGEGFHMRSSC